MTINTPNKDLWQIKITDEQLKKVNEHIKSRDLSDEQCQHDNCSDCHGSGVKKNGMKCIHMISCRCKKCSPFKC